MKYLEMSKMAQRTDDSVLITWIQDFFHYFFFIITLTSNVGDLGRDKHSRSAFVSFCFSSTC